MLLFHKRVPSLVWGAVLLTGLPACTHAQNAATAGSNVTSPTQAQGLLESLTSSSSQANFSASLVADGTSGTFWVSNGTEAGQGPTRERPQWIQFNFRVPITAQELTVEGRPGYEPREGELQVSDDGKTFRSLAPFAAQRQGSLTLKFAPTKAKHFRLVIFRAFDPRSPDSSRNVQIAELRLKGQDDMGKNASWPQEIIAQPEVDETTRPPGVVTSRALTIDGTYGQSINGQSFQQEALTSLNGWQYCSYYDAARHVCVARRKLPVGTQPAGEWQIARLNDYDFKGDDAHNTISLGICPNDGTIHLAFDHHGSTLHYRVSQKQIATQPDKVKWGADLFGPVTNKLEKPTTRVTYPLFLQTPKGDLQLFYRFGGSGAGQWWMVDYDAASGTWRRTRQIDSGEGIFKDQFNESKNRNAYPNGFHYGPKGRLHYTWTWRENTQGANHDICYAYSDDGGLTWRNNAGVVVNPGDGKQVITLDSPGIVVVSLDRSQSLMNEQTQEVDSKDRIHVVMWHRREGTTFDKQIWVPTNSRYYHYWRDEQGKWQKGELPSDVGTRPKILFDAADNAYVIYTVNRDPKTWSHLIYFLNGQICVAKASAASRWTDWTITHPDANVSYLSELLGDAPRLKKDGVLSIFAQESPKKPRDVTPLHVIDIPPTK